MKKTKTNPPAALAAHTRADVESLVAEIDQAANSERMIAATRDAELLAIREKYQANLEALGERVREATAAAQMWAETNPQEFGRLKSIEFSAGVIGFRTGTPKLKPLPKWTFDRVLATLRGAPAGTDSSG